MRGIHELRKAMADRLCRSDSAHIEELRAESKRADGEFLAFVQTKLRELETVYEDLQRSLQIAGALQPPPNFTRLNANDRIITRRVVGIAMENLGSDRAFFQKLVMPFQAVLYHVRKKLFSPGGTAEGWTFEDLFKFAQDDIFRLTTLRW